VGPVVSWSPYTSKGFDLEGMYTAWMLDQPWLGHITVEIDRPDPAARPAWRLCQWATRLSLAGAPLVRLPDGDLSWENETKRVVIGPGGGTDVVMAIAAGSPSVTAVEMNPLIVDCVRRLGAAALARGPVAAVMTSAATARGVKKLVRRVTLYADIKRIDFAMSLVKSQSSRTLDDYARATAKGKEAAALGVTTVLLPQGNAAGLRREETGEIQMIGAASVRQAADMIF
jgi:hypothetical protein